MLWADAFAAAASSLLHLYASDVLATLLGVPQAVLAMSGIGLLVYVAAATYLAVCDPVPRTGVKALIAANWVWVGGCAVIFWMHAPALTALGQAYIAVHAVAVAALAELEWFALRREPRVGWA
jgi:hypothetical protein